MQVNPVAGFKKELWQAIEGIASSNAKPARMIKPDISVGYQPQPNPNNKGKLNFEV